MTYTFPHNLTTSLINRNNKICKIFDWLLNCINDILRKNDFLLFLFFLQKTISNILNKIFLKEETSHIVNKDEIYLRIPYLAPIKHLLKIKLSKLISIISLTVENKIVFTSIYTIDSFFSDPITKFQNLCVHLSFFKFICSGCSGIYIGKTLRNLFIRTDRHRVYLLRNRKTVG